MLLILEEKLQTFTVEYEVDLSYMTLTVLRYIPSIPDLLRVFFIIGCCILLNVFFHPGEIGILGI